MLLQDLVRETKVGAWMFTIGITLFISVITFIRAKTNKSMEDDERKIAYSWALFLIIITIANLLGFINRLYNDFNPNVDKIAVFLVNLAFFFRVYNVEKNIKLFKFKFFTIIQGIVLVSFIFTNMQQSTVLNYILIALLGIGFLILPLTYLLVAIKSTGPVRTQCLQFVAAFMLIAFGLAFQEHNIQAYLPSLVSFVQITLHIQWIFIPTTSILLGVLLLFYSYSKILV